MARGSERSYSVFVQNPAFENDGFLNGAPYFYKKYSRIGNLPIRRVRTKRGFSNDVTRFSPDSKGMEPGNAQSEVGRLLEQIALKNNDHVLIVNHSRPGGMLLQIGGFSFPYASTQALAYLIFMATLRLYQRNLAPFAKQKPEKGAAPALMIDRKRDWEAWLPLLEAMTKKRVLSDSFEELVSQGDTFKPNKPLLKEALGWIEEGKKLFSGRYKSVATSPDIESFKREIKASLTGDKEYDEYATVLGKYNAIIEEWIFEDVLVQLGIDLIDLDNYITAINRVYQINVQKVVVHACNFGGGIGDAEAISFSNAHDYNLRVLNALLGSQEVSGPIVYCVLSSPKMEITTGLDRRGRNSFTQRARKKLREHRNNSRNSKELYGLKFGHSRVYRNPTNFKPWRFVYVYHGAGDARHRRSLSRISSKHLRDDVVFIYGNYSDEDGNSQYESTMFAQNPQAVHDFLLAKIGQNNLIHDPSGEPLPKVDAEKALGAGNHVNITWLKSFPPAFPGDRRHGKLMRTYKGSDRMPGFGKVISPARRRRL